MAVDTHPVRPYMSVSSYTPFLLPRKEGQVALFPLRGQDRAFVKVRLTPTVN